MVRFPSLYENVVSYHFKMLMWNHIFAFFWFDYCCFRLWWMKPAYICCGGILVLTVEHWLHEKDSMKVGFKLTTGYYQANKSVQGHNQADFSGNVKVNNIFSSFYVLQSMSKGFISTNIQRTAN